MDLREPKQREAVEAFLSSSRKNSIEMGTGLGKSKVVVDILKGLDIEEPWENQLTDTLLLVPSERLRDTDWIVNLKKFGYDINRIRLECIQTAYKWKDVYFKRVIVDEADFTFTPEFSKFYFNNKYDILICITAFTDEKKRELRDKIAPVCFSFSTQDAQKLGLLNKTEFYQVNFDLLQQRTMQIKMKNGRFFKQSENGNYLYIDNMFNKSLISLQSATVKFNKAEILGEPSEEYEKKMKKFKHAVEFHARKRKEFLHSLDSSKQVAILLKNKILQSPQNKILIFSKLTKQIDQITEHTFYAKNKKGNKNVELFSTGDIRDLGVCETLNRGANIEGINHILLESYVGSDTDFQQKHGRGTRLSVDDILKVFIMVPWVWDRIETVDKVTLRKTYRWEKRPTQAYRWMQEMTSEFDISNLEQINLQFNRLTNSYVIPEKYDKFFNRS